MCRYFCLILFAELAFFKNLLPRRNLSFYQVRSAILPNFCYSGWPVPLLSFVVLYEHPGSQGEAPCVRPRIRLLLA